MSSTFPSTQLPLGQIVEEMRFSVEARAVVAEVRSSSQAYQLLQQHSFGPELLGLVARCLPKRFVVVWLCQCVRNHPRADGEDQMADMAAVSLAERWLRQATEENRRSAADYATKGDFQSLGDWVAAAVGWTEGSLAPPSASPVPPADHLCATAAVAALLILSARDPERMLERQLAFARLASEMFA